MNISCNGMIRKDKQNGRISINKISILGKGKRCWCASRYIRCRCTRLIGSIRGYIPAFISLQSQSETNPRSSLFSSAVKASLTADSIPRRRSNNGECAAWYRHLCGSPITTPPRPRFHLRKKNTRARFEYSCTSFSLLMLGLTWLQVLSRESLLEPGEQFCVTVIVLI